MFKGAKKKKKKVRGGKKQKQKKIVKRLPKSMEMEIKDQGSDPYPHSHSFPPSCQHPCPLLFFSISLVITASKEKNPRYPKRLRRPATERKFKTPKKHTHCFLSHQTCHVAYCYLLLTCGSTLAHIVIRTPLIPHLFFPLPSTRRWQGNEKFI
jgi:hypothetical protein